MKIKNKYIEIKTKDKKYRICNMILNTYLNEIAKRQYFNSDKFLPPDLARCFVKLNYSLPVEEEGIYYHNDFDFEIEFEAPTIINKGLDTITIERNFKFPRDMSYDNITMIGFFGEENESPCYSLLDVNDLSLESKKEIPITIKRVDEIYYDGILNSDHEFIDCPAHLSCVRTPDLYEKDGFKQIRSEAYGKIYSIGLGIRPNEMIKEILLNEENTILKKNEIKFTSLFESQNDVGLKFPEINNYCLQQIFPMKQQNQFEYFIIKYKICVYVYNDDLTEKKVAERDEFYTMSYKIKKGKFNMLLKYERR